MWWSSLVVQEHKHFYHKMAAEYSKVCFICVSARPWISQLDHTSVTDNKSYVSVHQFILPYKVPRLVSRPVSAKANLHLSNQHRLKLLKLSKLLHCTVQDFLYQRSQNINGQFHLTAAIGTPSTGSLVGLSTSCVLDSMWWTFSVQRMS